MGLNHTPESVRLTSASSRPPAQSLPRGPSGQPTGASQKGSMGCFHIRARRRRARTGCPVCAHSPRVLLEGLPLLKRTAQVVAWGTFGAHLVEADGECRRACPREFWGAQQGCLGRQRVVTEEAGLGATQSKNENTSADAKPRRFGLLVTMWGQRE